MAKRRKGLGRGLDALLGSEGPNPAAAPQEAATGQASSAPPKIVGRAREVEASRLTPNRFQPRTYFDDSGIEDLAESIRAQGVVQPIVVMPRIEDGEEQEYGEERFSIIAGERRWRAAQKAGLETVPIVIRDVADDQQLLELALVENIQRADLNPVEEAEAYRMLSEKFGISQEEIGKKVGRGRTTITNSLRLLRLPPVIQDLLREGRLTSGQARPLLSISDPELQIEIAQRAVEEGLTARQLESLVSEPKEAAPTEKKEKPEPDVHTRAAIEKLMTSLQTKVDIVRKKKGGEVRIRFNSEEELIRLYDRLLEGDD